MVNIELRCLALILKLGNFEPIIKGDITEDTMTTEQGKILFNFITTYRSSTDGVARYPSLGIVRQRFQNSAIELPDPDPSDELVALVYETKNQRFKAEVQSIALQLDQSVHSADDTTETVVGLAGRLRRLTDKMQSLRHTSLSTGIQEIVADYDAGSILPDGIPWMWPSLQRATRGMQKGNFIILAGRPKSRKTFTAFALGAHAAVHSHARVLIFSPEMKRKQALLRIVASVCGLRYTEFKDSALSQAEEMRLIEAARTYGRWPDDDDETYSFRLRSAIPGIPEGALPSIDIVESTGKSPVWMASQIELFQPDVVIADSYYRQTPTGSKRGDTDWKAQSSLSRDGKDLAMDSNVVFIATHQLNRGAEKTVGSAANLGYSDAFGQDMDLGFRIITGTDNGEPVSAVITLGAREIAFDGILINNVPCADFSEKGLITNRKIVENLLAQENEKESEESDDNGGGGGDDKRSRGRKDAVGPKNSHAQVATAAAKVRAKMQDFNHGKGEPEGEEGA